MSSYSYIRNFWTVIYRAYVHADMCKVYEIFNVQSLYVCKQLEVDITAVT
jgi:hypothetical protein